MRSSRGRFEHVLGFLSSEGSRSLSQRTIDREYSWLVARGVVLPAMVGECVVFGPSRSVTADGRIVGRPLPFAVGFVTDGERGVGPSKGHWRDGAAPHHPAPERSGASAKRETSSTRRPAPRDELAFSPSVPMFRQSIRPARRKGRDRSNGKFGASSELGHRDFGPV